MISTTVFISYGVFFIVYIAAYTFAVLSTIFGMPQNLVVFLVASL